MGYQPEDDDPQFTSKVTDTSQAPSTTVSAQTTTITSLPTVAEVPSLPTTVTSDDAETQVTDNESINTSPTGYNWLTGDDYIAQSYLVMDITSNSQIKSSYSDLPIEQGGFVRLMILYSLLNNDNFDLNQPVHLDDASDTSSIINTLSSVSAETALFSMFFEGNYVAVTGLASAFYDSPDEFLLAMNQNAEKLGMKDTAYYSLNENDRESKTTVNDLYLLLMALDSMPEFRALIDVNAYAVPNAGSAQITGTQLIENPAAIVAIMSSKYLKNLNGILLTKNADDWSCGVAKAEANDGSKYLAIVMGASSKIDSIQGDLRAAHVLRTILEESAVEEGIKARANDGILSVQGSSQQAQPILSDNSMTITDNTEGVSTQTSLIATTTEITKTDLESLALEDTTDQKHKRFPGIFIIIIGVLIFAVIALLVASIIIEVTKHKREKERRRLRDNRIPF